MAPRILDLAASFRRDLKAEGRAERTLDLYGQTIRFYVEWLQAQQVEPTLDALDRAHIRAWLAELAGRQELSTVRTRFKGLHRFCGWLLAEGEVEAHPMAGMEAPTPPERPVPVLDDDALARLLKACAGKTFEDRRDEAMIRVLLDCGVRVSELTGLTVSGVNLDGETALVSGKGSKVRPVYFGSRTARALDRYLRMRAGHRWAHLDALWLSQRGAMSPDGVRERLNVRTEAAGLGHIHPHQFRHTFAHDYLLAGGQERDLKRLAGWTSDAMLERYGASAADHRARQAARRLRRGDRL